MCTPPSLELYIYYRVPAADAERAIATVLAWQRSQTEGGRLSAAVLRRPAPPGDPADVTCMEIYRGRAVGEPGFADRLDTALGAAWRAAGLPAVHRHLEWFTPCA